MLEGDCTRNTIGALTWDCLANTIVVFVQNHDVHSKDENIHDQVTTPLDGNGVIYHRHVFLLDHPSKIFDFAKHGSQTDFPLVKADAVNPDLTLHFQAFHSDQGESHIGPST